MIGISLLKGKMVAVLLKNIIQQLIQWRFTTISMKEEWGDNHVKIYQEHILYNDTDLLS